MSGLGDLVRTLTAIASTIDDGLSVIFSAEKAQLCTTSNEQNILLGVYRSRDVVDETLGKGV